MEATLTHLIQKNIEFTAKYISLDARKIVNVAI